jgi:uncharacterized metal-binding protein YceD (DUF177 family)
MKFKGRVHIREVETRRFEIDGQPGEDWVLAVLRRAAPPPELMNGMSVETWVQESSLEVQVRIDRAASDYIVSGRLKGHVPNLCARCGDPLHFDRASEFHVVVHRLAREETEVDGDSGDADYVFLDGDEIDLIEILGEQLIILEPVAEAPARCEDGSCSLCGKNPQFADQSAGQAVENKADSPFAKLSSLKLKKVDGG